jgi:hypothetical protein
MNVNTNRISLFNHLFQEGVAVFSFPLRSSVGSNPVEQATTQPSFYFY